MKTRSGAILVADFLKVVRATETDARRKVYATGSSIKCGVEGLTV